MTETVTTHKPDPTITQTTTRTPGETGITTGTPETVIETGLVPEVVPDIGIELDPVTLTPPELDPKIRETTIEVTPEVTPEEKPKKGRRDRMRIVRAENPKDPKAGWSPSTPNPRVVSYVIPQQVDVDLKTGVETRRPLGKGLQDFKVIRFDSDFHPDKELAGVLVDVHTDAAGNPVARQARQRTGRRAKRSPKPKPVSARQPWAPAEVRREAKRVGYKPRSARRKRKR